MLSQRCYPRLLLLVSTVGSASAAGPTVLNLSHDLVTYGIATQNMTPNMPGLDSRPLFQAAVAYASKNNIPTVTADRGSYYFLTLNSQYQHVYLNGISNVTVDLNYSDLYFAQGSVMAIDANNCTNLTLQNFTVDYLQLPFTQLEVTSVDANNRVLGVSAIGSYRTPTSFNAVTIPSNLINDGYYVLAFRNGRQLRSTGRMAAAAPTSDTSIQINDTSPWAQSANVSTIEPGDTVVFYLRAGAGTIFASNSTGLTVHNVSIYASGFIGLNTTYGSGITVDHVQVIPRPGTDRLISTNADGIHLNWAGSNNVISNNTIRRGCDDAIAIDGQWYAIVNAPNTGATVPVALKGSALLPVGASFDFINIVTAAVQGTATIVSESPPPSQQTGTAGELVTLTLDRTISGLQTNFGVMPSDPDFRGNGSVIHDNLIQEENFARGIYTPGVENVTVINNMIEYTNQSGILVEQDEGLTYNYKTGPASGLLFQNNVVDHALGYGVPSNNVLSFAGAINVVAYDQHFNWVTFTPLSNITFSGNFVTNSPGTGIRMENAASGKIVGNTILNYGLQPTNYLWYFPSCTGCETQAQLESDLQEPVVVANSGTIANSSNTTTGNWVVNVSDADGGYRLAPNSIAVAYGENLGPTPMQAGGANLPTILGGVSVNVTDSAGVSRLAGMYYVSSGQVDYVIPAGTAPGVATVTVGKTPSAALIEPVGPSLFSANGSGAGVAAALAVLAAPDGTQIPENVFECSGSNCTPAPLSLGTSNDILVVELYGTGIRGNSGLSNVVAEIGGVPAQVAYAGAQPQYAGLDQVNVYVPQSLAGAGVVPVVLTVDGVTANVVTIDVK